MRRSELERGPKAGLDLFSRAETAHLVHGDQIRIVHPIVYEGEVWFHSAPAGEKTSWIGQHATLSTFETVCRVASHWRHPDRACPATTYYRSAQVAGVLVAEQDLARKASVLQAMMERYQPEGVYRTITPHDPMYAKVVEHLCVARVQGAMVSKFKLGQDLGAAALQRVLQGLWERGLAGDDAAIETLVNEHDQVPPFLCGPHGTRLLSRIPAVRSAEALALVRDAYWNTRWFDATIEATLPESAIWVGVEHQGRLIATARALSDRSKMTYVLDVLVAPNWRKRGIGDALMRHLLDHPWAQTAWVSLHTRAATVGFYERMGFKVRSTCAQGSELRELRLFRKAAFVSRTGEGGPPR